MSRSPRHSAAGAGRAEPNGRRWFTGVLVAAIAAGLWLGWARWAATLNWVGLSDVGVICVAGVTTLLLVIVPWLPTCVWAAGRRGTARRVALLLGVLMFGALLTLDLWLVRM